jgi:sulfur carrier protein ThiS
VYQRNRPDPFEIDLPDCADVTALIRTLEIDPLKHEIIVGVNGELGRPDSCLAEGDEVMLVTPMQGGLGTWKRVPAR